MMSTGRLLAEFGSDSALLRRFAFRSLRARGGPSATPEPVAPEVQEAAWTNLIDSYGEGVFVPTDDPGW